MTGCQRILRPSPLLLPLPWVLGLLIAALPLHAPRAAELLPESPVSAPGAEAPGGGGAASPAVSATAPAAALRQILESGWQPPGLRRIDERRHVYDSTRALYRQRDYAPLWLDRPTAARDLLAGLAAAKRQALDPREYRPLLLVGAQTPGARTRGAGRHIDPGQFAHLEAAAAARVELGLTLALLAYAHDLWDGRVEPQDVADEQNVFIRHPPLDPVKVVQRARSDGLGAVVEWLSPDAPHYRRLLRAYNRERRRQAEAADAAALLAVSDETVVNVGQRHGLVRAVAERLHDLGYLATELPAEESAAALRWTPAMAAALRAFQAGRGLAADGVIGPNTLNLLRRGAEDRLQTVALNLDRWRWLPRDLGDEYLLVNVPEYRLRYLREGREVLSMRIIAGDVMHETPVFTDELEYVVFAPYWNVPRSIVTRELLPQFRRDPALLQEKRMQVVDESGRVIPAADIDWRTLDAQGFPWMVRQLPGPDNALGRVKFLFPNKHAIYLHDTPADELFARSDRSFSHGCIRVERPALLARYLLEDQPEWTLRRVRGAMRSSEEQWVNLERKVPVYITYFTAVADEEYLGSRLFRDVYGHDAAMRAALRSESLPAAPLVGTGVGR